MAFEYPKFFYDSRLADATPVASSTGAGSVLNLRDWRPYTWWKPASVPATVTVDCGSAKSVDYWLLWGHDLASVGATAELRRSSDNFAANDVLVDSVAPSSDAPFARKVTSSSARYWRLRFTGAVPTIAIAALGVALTSPVPLPPGFDPLKRDIHAATNRSSRGYGLGRVIEWEEWAEDLELQWVSQTWLRDSFLPAWEAHLKHTPFVFGWDIGDHPDEIYLVEADAKRETPHQAGGYAHLRVRLSGVAE